MDGVTEVSRVVASGTTGVVFKVRVTRSFGSVLF